MKTKYIIIIIFSFFLWNCDKKEDDNNLFKVDGIIFQDGAPINNTKVTIDNAINYTTYTDNNGRFTIDNVTQGNHIIEIYKESEDNQNSFASRSYDLNVNTDTSLNSLTLPIPVILLEPTQTTPNSITLNWNASNAEDFREYKIYKHSSSGIDETTGELIHVSTDINDTSFTYEEVSPLEDYYFRVFILNEFGLLGGSNIVSISTDNSNFFNDGGFETNQALNYWGLSSSTVTNLDSNIKYIGNYSLHLARDLSNANSNRTITHQQFTNLTIGQEYIFSFWFRTEGTISECSDVAVRFTNAYQWYEQYPFCGSVTYANEEWLYYEFRFISEAESFPLSIYFDAFSDIWIDDLIFQRF